MGDSGFQAYMNKSTIIVKVQGKMNYLLLKVEQRFQDDSKVKEIPGPGHYVYLKSNSENKQAENQKLDDVRNQILQDIQIQLLNQKCKQG